MIDLTSENPSIDTTLQEMFARSDERYKKSDQIFEKQQEKLKNLGENQHE